MEETFYCPPAETLFCCLAGSALHILKSRSTNGARSSSCRTRWVSSISLKTENHPKRSTLVLILIRASSWDESQSEYVLNDSSSSMPDFTLGHILLTDIQVMVPYLQVKHLNKFGSESFHLQLLFLKTQQFFKHGSLDVQRMVKQSVSWRWCKEEWATNLVWSSGRPTILVTSCNTASKEQPPSYSVKTGSGSWSSTSFRTRTLWVFVGPFQSLL